MDRKTLDEIRVRCDVAEEAVWELDVGDCNISDNGTCDRDCCNGCGTWKWSAGADKIIQSLKDIPALLDYIAKLEAKNTELGARLEEYRFKNSWIWEEPDEANKLENMVDCAEVLIPVYKFKRALELLQSEADGRLVRLPCIPINKTLYWIWGDMIMPVLYKGIIGGCVAEDKRYHITYGMITKKSRTFTRFVHRKPQEIICKAGDKRVFYHDDIGKTIFLTREEAKAALEGQKKNKRIDTDE